jgi:mono/diheme cytochrome c family protein
VLFEENCAACHSADSLKPKLTGWSKEKVRASLDKLPALNPAMPDYTASAADKEAMAGYMFSLNNPGVTAPAKDQGATLFEENCAACHSFDQIKPKMAGWSRDKMRTALDKLSALNSAMPDYTGTPAEKDAMADYMAKQTGGAK